MSSHEKALGKKAKTESNVRWHKSVADSKKRVGGSIGTLMNMPHKQN